MERNLALLLSSLALILLFGCAAQQPEQGPIVSEEPSPSQNGTANATPELSPCTQQAILERDSCNLQYARESHDAAACARIYSVGKKDECISLFSGSDVSFCGQYALKPNKDQCLFGFANRTRDLALCLRIGDEGMRSECSRLLTPACQSIESTSERARCLAFELGDYTRCADEDCLFEYGTKKRDADACGIILQSARMRACEAIALANDSRCLLLSENVSRDVCYEIAGVGLLSSATCLRAYSESMHQQSCLTKLALATLDPSLCSLIGRQLGADNCYINYTLSSGRYELCSNVQNVLLRQGCYRNTAVRYLMPTLCENYLNGSIRSDCFSAIMGSANLTSDRCAGIALEEWHDLCYLRSAKLKYDPGICQSIINEATRRNCIRESTLGS